MNDSEKVLNIAFYRFVTIEDPAGLRGRLMALARRCRLKGTILIAPEGINGGLSGLRESAEEFVTGITAEPEFAGMYFKRTFSPEVPFKKLLIKVKKEILTIRDPSADPRRFDPHYIQPTELREALARGEKLTLIDVRNNFEVGYGSFRGALNPETKSFGEFEKFVKERLGKSTAADARIVTFCTGGIRCEKAEILLRRHGFKNVRQLEGGILEYFRQTDGAYFVGTCFVFDEREALDKTLRPINKTGV